VIAVVKAGDILEVVWVSLVAAVFVSTVFSFVVVGGARSAEARRNGSGTAAVVWAGLAVLAFALFAAAVAYGVHIMLSKS
jgi:tetrahydromethanopterin S-methyltransferase subunit D